MDSTGAPAVVAVVVTRDPGPWFEETLEYLAAQDYPDLVVVVVAAGGAEDPTDRVGRVFPEAFVRRMEEPLSFAAAADQMLEMVEGASFFLFCHDDCAPEPDAVRLLVEESYRSNAAIVSPKIVRWDDPLVLLHVGMSADKTGAVVDRVQSPEIDAGQHDGVRDIFVAPSGCTLVRTDLFAALGGYDATNAGMAEDLDLCWRTQVAGGRVVVAPDARVRHLEITAAGVPPVLTGENAGLTMQALQRRHELKAVLTCYSAFSLLRVLPQIVALNLGEILVALVARDRARASAVFHAWRFNLAHRSEVRTARARTQANRQVHDATIRHNQLHGSARLSEYLSNVSHHGFEVTHARVGGLARADDEVEEPELTGSIAGAFAEDDSFDEDWDDRGRFARRPRRARVLASRRSRLLAGLVAALLLVVGARDLFSGALPQVGQFLSFPSWTGAWHQFFASWQPAGLGTTAPSSPAFAALGVLGTVLFGGMGLAQKVVVLGSLPLGAWGMSRLVGPFGSRRGRFVAAVAYLGLPLIDNAIARGRLDGVVAFALAPWVVATLMRASQVEPFEVSLGRHSRPRRMQVLGLGVVLALGIAFAPALAVAALVTGIGLWLGSLLIGQRVGAGRPVLAAVSGLVVAIVLCLPWVVGTLFAGSHAVGIFGLPPSPVGAPGWSALLRFDVGPVGGSALSWLLPVAALLPLVIGSGPRLAWAGRLWCVALLSWLLALAVVRGWTHSFAPSPDVLLAPAAVAVAAGVGLGVAAFETDLVGHRFGWRQFATTLLLLAAAFGVIPAVAEVSNGSFSLPSLGFNTALQFLTAKPPASYRVLWLGDPAALPLGSWSAGPGLAYATTESGLPGPQNLFAPANPGPAVQLSRALSLAQDGGTVHLGRLLASAAVDYVVVVENLAPDIPGVQGATSYPVPAELLSTLGEQSDLRQIPGGDGFVVYVNTVALPERAVRGRGAIVGTEPTSGPAAGIPVPAAGDLAGWRAVLPGAPGAAGVTGAVPAGTLYSALAPGGDFGLSVGGVAAPRSAAFSWASQFDIARGGPASLGFSGWPLAGIGGGIELVVWLVVVSVLLDRRFALRARLRALAATPASETTLPPPPSRSRNGGPVRRRGAAVR